MTTFHHAGLSHRGRVRRRNEDTWTSDADQGLYLVSDGMGGEAEGALASRIVAETLPILVQRRTGGLADDATVSDADGLSHALAELSDLVGDEARRQPGLHGMGATVVLALMSGKSALIAHMGDSRAYLLRDGELQRLTRDHSLVQLLLDTGDITEEGAEDHPSRGQITRYVGMSGEALPEVRRIDLRSGDRLLLCSDGLTGMLKDEQILAHLANPATPKAACGALVSAANDAGGRDNVTAVVVDVAGDAPEVRSAGC